jgi:hypothetical protein
MKTNTHLHVQMLDASALMHTNGGNGLVPIGQGNAINIITGQPIAVIYGTAPAPTKIFPVMIVPPADWGKLF